MSWPSYQTDGKLKSYFLQLIWGTIFLLLHIVYTTLIYKNMDFYVHIHISRRLWFKDINDWNGGLVCSYLQSTAEVHSRNRESNRHISRVGSQFHTNLHTLIVTIQKYRLTVQENISIEATCVTLIKWSD